MPLRKRTDKRTDEKRREEKRSTTFAFMTNYIERNT